MGHVHSRPSTATDSSTRTKAKGSSSRPSFLDANLALSASAWTTSTSRFSRRGRSQRRSASGRAEHDEEKARQRQEVQQYLAHAIEQQREAEQTLADTRSVRSVPRLVVGDYGVAPGGPPTSSRTARPGSSGSARSAAPSMSTSSSATPWTSLESPHLPPARSSRWSESSASSNEDEPASVAAPAMPFHSFRNSLNRLPRDRLSVLLAHPDKLDEADVAVASAVLYGQPKSTPARRLKGAKVRGPIRIVAAAPMSVNRYAELEERRAKAAVPASPRLSPTSRSARTARSASPVGPRVQEQAARTAIAVQEPARPRSSNEDLSGFIAASPQLAFPGSDGFFPHGDSAPAVIPPVRPPRPASAVLPPSHPLPAGQQTRLGRLDRLSVPATQYGLPPHSSTSPASRTRLDISPLSPRSMLGSVAEDSPSSSSPSPSGADVLVCLSPSAARCMSPASTLSRPSLLSSSSSNSFPRSVALDEGLSEGLSPPARDELLPSASPDAEACRGHRTLPPGEERRPFSRYSLAPSFAESDLPSSTLDAFPAPPQMLRLEPVAAVRRQANTRNSVPSSDASSTEHGGTLTPMTMRSSGRSSAPTTAQSSLDMSTTASRNTALAVDFSAALGASTFAPVGAEASKVAASVDWPIPSRTSSSLGTSILDDLVDELVAAAAMSPLPSPAAVDPHVEVRALEEAEDRPPPVPPKEARRPASAPRPKLVLRAFSAPAVPALSPRTRASPSDRKSARLVSYPPAPSPTAPGLAAYRFPPVSPRKVHFEGRVEPRAPVVPASDEAVRLGSRKKRGFSKDEVGDWIARARRESDEV
ncbi:uncharacterized protein RHOBADRAFT_51686 [Rhodotorula graminis WP1]|uniref:Uncharacterized protein n=1 Tax=Rhodotorula graminis (strain WP1) TaxID=578459 RepID=A0A194SBA5_RHOGW|nr:uncharacterized protein RHOBADRAFT_51686 [Rhodotorula graminis WP1]KPV77887.1 hypothetical protein RHOBADRAFT_51686 [Rhodotorula graminis WP1]